MSDISLLGQVFILPLVLSGCLGVVAGSAVDVTLEVAKVPFKVAGAIVDVAVPDDRKEEKEQ
ncbi:MAG: NF038104 family lipoprotein [Pseudomonadales bacterium]|nr:NF038104 family lipoprotein [Pseudomonadales bacterium]